MGKPRDDRSKDLFQPALEEIIDMGHALCGWPRDRLGLSGLALQRGLPGQASRRCRHGWWRG
jgi:hypothetical protein